MRRGMSESCCYSPGATPWLKGAGQTRKVLSSTMKSFGCSVHVVIVFRRSTTRQWRTTVKLLEDSHCIMKCVLRDYVLP